MSNEQDLRFVRTNQLLINAFSDLLSHKKFEDITVNELCELALVRRATFYTHFLDKYDFFAFFVRQHRDSFSRNLPTPEAGRDANAFYLCMSRQLINYLTTHRTMVENVINSSAFPILLSILSDTIYEDLTAELCSTNVQLTEEDAAPEVLASFYAGGLIQIITRWLSHPNEMSEETLTDQIARLIRMHPLTFS